MSRHKCEGQRKIEGIFPEKSILKLCRLGPIPTMVRGEDRGFRGSSAPPHPSKRNLIAIGRPGR
jgi:hypothetical protein